MEAAVRWSPHSTASRQRFLVVDVADPHLTLNEVDSLTKRDITYHAVSKSGKVSNFVAFDWSKTNPSLIALGLVSGSASLIKLREDGKAAENIAQFKLKQQRKCNSIAFSAQDWLAVAVDRARSDVCLFIYDTVRGQANEPVRRLCAAELVSSVRFFPSQPLEVVASTQRQYVRVYDLRDGYGGGGGAVLQAATRNINNIAIDPRDENYFASAGSTDDPAVTVWDRRWMSPSPPSGSSTGAVFDFRPAVNNSVKTTVWSLRYSGQRRGRLAICSSSGELTVIDMMEGKISNLRSSDYVPSNPYGGAGPWTSNRYVSDITTLERPWHDPLHGRDSKKRIIAYDWILDGEDDVLDGQAILALRPNREVDILRVPTVKPLASITPRQDLSISFGDLSITEPSPSNKSEAPKAPYENTNGTTATASPEDFGPHASPGEDVVDSTLGHFILSRDSPKLGQLLASSTIDRSRCLQGYLFDCQKNASIVAGNWQLSRLWEIVNRFRDQAARDGMVSSGLDLSYVGISGLWSENVGSSPNRRTAPLPEKVEDTIAGLIQAKDIPAFEGHRTNFPEHRQLCLAACGWKFTSDALEAECNALIESGLYYQAIVQAVLHGYRHIALNLLRTLIRSKTIPNIGLGPLLASESVNEEQREMCMWMAADTDEPALKALLTFLISGSWRDVMKTSYLHLGYRLALGLKYLSDTELSGFIQTETARAIKNGDLEGILLTGLGEQAMDLFQTYIARTNDLQTAVLAMAFANPLYVEDVRWELWKEVYFDQMQAWRAFVQRTKFTIEHNRLARTRDGRTLVDSKPGQIELRCLHCQESLASTDSRYVNGQAPQTMFSAPSTPTTRAPAPAASAGTTCPRCGRHLPRCGLCQLWLGTPRPGAVKGVDPKTGASAASKHAANAAGSAVSGNDEGGRAGKEDLMAKMITFCRGCGHGFHADHARQWFSKHTVCPVVGCECACMALG
jgi:hypothetical protein